MAESRRQKSAQPLGASTQFDQKRNFGEHSFIRGVGNQRQKPYALCPMLYDSGYLFSNSSFLFPFF
jgi:hypothetical protein